MSRLALKVDVDTYRGTLEGVPRLLDLFAKEGVKATFFFSLGPDTSGKAIKRVFRKGFVKKVLSASPAASYGLKTMLYGTLLPAPDIGGRPETVARMREAAKAGHSGGLHAWDHIDWHDLLPKMTRGEIDAVTFTSSSTVTHLCDALGEGAAELFTRTRVASIGPVTSETARGRGLRVDIEAREYTVPGLLEALREHFTHERSRSKS